MPLSFKCPHCGAEITVKYLKLGDICICDNCGRESIIPDPTQGATQADKVQAGLVDRGKPLSKNAYIGWFVGVNVFGFAVLFVIGFATTGNETVLVANGLFSLLVRVVSVVICLNAWYRAWKAIQDGHARTTPGKAIGFLFIPLFSFYWVFQWSYGYAKDYNAFRKRHEIDGPILSEGLFLSLSILVAGYPVIRLLPLVWILYGFAIIVLSALVLAKICDAANAALTQPMATRDMRCPHCGGELELDDEDIAHRGFTCPLCNRWVSL